MFRIAVLLAALSVAAFAQLPRGFYPWWDQPVAKDLNLTAPQLQEIRAATREFRGKLIEQRAAVEKAEVELQFVVDDDNVDLKRANQAIEDLANARENLTRTYSQFALKLRLVLTPQQWREVQKRHQEVQQQRRDLKNR